MKPRRVLHVAWLSARLGVLGLGMLMAISTLVILTATPAAQPVRLADLDPTAELRVFVLTWGYHSSIFVEQPSGWRLGPVGDEDAPFVEYGWGDRRFYMESNFALHSLFASAMLPTETVVYVCGHHAPPNEEVVGGHVYVRRCTSREVVRLVTILEQQMTRAPDGSRPPVHPATPEYPGRFYPGREWYVVWWNCNMWTVRMLRDAGLSEGPACVFAPWQVADRIRAFEELRTRSG